MNVRRPEGVAARVRLSGGAAGLRLDERRLGAVCDETGLESHDYAGATDRYTITITGGANKVSVLYG